MTFQNSRMDCLTRGALSRAHSASNELDAVRMQHSEVVEEATEFRTRMKKVRG